MGLVRAREEGMTLIELLVALLVLGVVMSGVVAVTISTMRVTVINDTRTVASNIAQAEVERVRALPFEQLEVIGRTETVRDGYLITRDTSWVGLDADVDVCSAPASANDTALVRIDVMVRPQQPPPTGTVHEVSTSTTIARPPMPVTSSTGTLSVLVFDHQVPPSGTSAVVVTATGPVPSSGEVRLQTTPASGCVLFTSLPAGTYQVGLQRAGYVTDGVGANRDEPVVSVDVTAGARRSIEMAYASAATLQPSWVARDGAAIALPTEQPVTVDRSGLVLFGASGTDLASLFPAPWDLWAGDCPAADPQAEGTGGAFWPGGFRQDPVVPTPGGTSPAGAEVTRVRWDLGAVAGDVVEPPVAAVVATVSPAQPDGCAEGTSTLTFPAVDVAVDEAAGTAGLELGLPYGVWHLQASNAHGSVHATTVVVDPAGDDVVVVASDGFVPPWQVGP